MDWAAGKRGIREGFRRYRYVMLAALLGIFLMMIPEQTQEIQIQEAKAEQPVEDLETSLERLLSQVYGAGKVEVLLTQKEGARTIYQNNESRNETSNRTDTVLVTDADRNETGLVYQVLPPIYRGAVILCQGADQPQVRLSLVEAVCRATGLSSDLISVMKMK